MRGSPAWHAGGKSAGRRSTGGSSSHAPLLPEPASPLSVRPSCLPSYSASHPAVSSGDEYVSGVYFGICLHRRFGSTPRVQARLSDLSELASAPGHAAGPGRRTRTSAAHRRSESPRGLQARRPGLHIIWEVDAIHGKKLCEIMKVNEFSSKVYDFQQN